MRRYSCLKQRHAEIHHWIWQPWFSALSYLTLINWAILRKVTFLGYPWDPSWGPADFFSDTVLLWEWNRHHHWIQLPRFSGLSYLTLVNFTKSDLRRVLGTLAGVLPMLFWALLASEGEIVDAIEFSNLVLVPFHTPYFNFGQRKPKLLVF